MWKLSWQVVKLSDIWTIWRWKSKHRPRNDSSLFWGLYPFLQTADIKSANLYVNNYNETYNEKGLKQSRLRNKWTLCITIAANIAETAILWIDACFPDSIIWFIADTEKVDTIFIKYYFDYQKANYQAISKWTTQDNLSVEKLLSLDLRIPPLPTQQRIASILSNYDDLIENNTRRIQILEEQAQALYRHWFVDFKFPWHENVKMVDSGTEFGMIPEGWEVKSLGEDILVKKWKNITKKTIIEWNVPVVAWWLNPAYFHNKANVHWPAITISASWANSWYVNIYYEDIWCSDCSYISYAETNNLFYYYTQLHFRQNEITHLQKGSAQPHVYPQDIMWLKVVSSIIWLESIFENTVTSFYNEIGNLKKQNINLRKQRDLLLPRLISGEILVD